MVHWFQSFMVSTEGMEVHFNAQGHMAEKLRRWAVNPLGRPSVGANPTVLKFCGYQ